MSRVNRDPIRPDCRARSAAVASLSLFFALGALRCSAPPEDERSELRLPPYEAFPPVGEALHSHCGSLDCHGDVARNLRLYGANGLRLSSAEIPGGSITTDDELRANYRSVVALEPELLSRVFVERGTEPERLTLIRKGRGTEHHKGGEAMTEGGAADRCIVSWIANAIDATVCMEAAEIVRPETPAPAP